MAAPSRMDVEEEFLSASLVGGNELGYILHKVDEISRSLGSDGPERQKLSKALQLTVSCAVRQTLLERELRSLALTDDLTGLYNRRGFSAAATQQLKLARRNTQESLLFFCYVDNLKEIKTLWNRHSAIPIFWLALVGTSLLFWHWRLPVNIRMQYSIA
jgi:predicted signal transduction protein with EAL and GGDEF domain